MSSSCLLFIYYNDNFNNQDGDISLSKSVDNNDLSLCVKIQTKVSFLPAV